MKSSTFDVVIAGAGIVGAACASELAGEGLRVAVVEPGEIGGGATSAGMGHIVVLDDSAAQLSLTRYAQRLWEELVPDLPADVPYNRCGTLWIAADEEEMAEVRRKAGSYLSHEIRAEVLDSRAVAEAEPNLRPGLFGGLLVPGDGVIGAPAAARFLLDRAIARGAKLFQGRRVMALEDSGALLDDGMILGSPIMINAAGTWAIELTPGLPIRRRKGHLVAFENSPGFVRHEIVELGYLKSAHASEGDSVAFNIQARPNGEILLGSSRQFGAEHSSVEPAIVERMVARGREFMPGISRLKPLRNWAGFRAATPDNLPLIGPHPSREGLYLAAGHEGLGITTSLATARLLLDQMLGRSPAIPLGPYLPSRLLPVDANH